MNEDFVEKLNVVIAKKAAEVVKSRAAAISAGQWRSAPAAATIPTAIPQTQAVSSG